MDIPIRTILQKMNQELQKTLVTENKDLIREHLLVIQTLCSLVLEEQVKEEEVTTTKQRPSLTSFSQDKLKETLKDEETNSDSLFEF